MWYTVPTLDFETSRNALASSWARYIQLKEEHEEDFGKIDYIRSPTLQVTPTIRPAGWGRDTLYSLS